MAKNNKLNWLDEVKADAKRITLKRIREAEENKAYEESKKNGMVTAEAESTADPAPGQGVSYTPEEEKKGKK